MAKKRTDVVVAYPNDPKIVASVATTPTMMVLALGDGREEHYTYPPDGRFHVTLNDGSSRSFFAPGPAYANLSYYRFALVHVPVEPTELVRPYTAASATTMTLPAPTEREGMLEVGVMGQLATPAIVAQLSADGATVGLFQGPRSDTTIVFRYTP
jgi:hypothetical protein